MPMLANAQLGAPVAGTSSNAVWTAGRSTHYGPYPQLPSASEAGYQPLDVGVGCSNGVPGGDPRWNKILANGTKTNPIMNSTVWPLLATVAVSEAAWGGKNKNIVCFQKLLIRNPAKPSVVVTAYVVDFCPTNGCNWASDKRQFNADLYGQDTWNTLGGSVTGGDIAVEIQWPANWVPNSVTTNSSALWLLVLYALMFT